MGALVKQDNTILKQGAYCDGHHLFLTDGQAHKAYAHYTKQPEQGEYTQDEILTILNQFSKLVLTMASAKNYQAIEGLSRWLSSPMTEATNITLSNQDNTI